MQLHNRDVRQDVRELGELLGNVLEGQTSRKSFETVESCRQTAIDYRAGDIDSRESLISELETLSPHQQRVVARAFTTYFELINLAEERERVRTIREASQEGTLEDSSRRQPSNSVRTTSRPSSRYWMTYSSSRRLPPTRLKPGVKRSNRSCERLRPTSKRWTNGS